MSAEPVPVRATLADWAPGQMRITLDGAAERPSYLVVGETWYPDWHAAVDGKSAPLLRADHALLSVVLPPGAREVTLHFASATYAKGKLVTLAALLATAVLLSAPLWRGRRRRKADG
jgi:uncharacterized membrane protein YfhO